MNVLLVDQFGQTGGAQKCLLDLICGWQGDDRLVVAAPADGTLLRLVSASGCAAIKIPSGPYGDARRLSDAARFCRDALQQRSILRRVIRQFEIDVVYANGPRVLPGAAWAARARCPVIFHAHNRLHRRSDMAMVRLALGLSSATVIACCEYAACGLDATVIHNGVSDAAFRERSRLPSGPWRIGIVGRISPEKGHLLLMDAVRKLADEGYQIGITIAGASLFSPGGYEEEVRRRAQGLASHFTGWIDNIGEALARLDLLAVPSIAEPGLPRVVLEAFSAGVPVVALPSGGIPEVIRDGRNGFLAAGIAADDLAEALRRAMMTASSELAKLTLRARAEWESYWNVDRWRHQVMEAIRAASNPRRSSGSFDALVASSERRPAA